MLLGAMKENEPHFAVGKKSCDGAVHQSEDTIQRAYVELGAAGIYLHSEGEGKFRSTDNTVMKEKIGRSWSSPSGEVIDR